MKMMILISVILAIAYTAVVTVKEKRLPESISSLVYGLPGAWKWSWTLWIWTEALLTGIPTTDALPDGWKFTGFLMMAGLTFVGAMPLFNKDSEKAHFFFAYLAGINTQICVALIYPWCLLLWLALPAVMVYDYWYGNNKSPWYEDKGVFICEVICYVTLVLSLLVII